jgi:hypothetical protein
MARGNNQKLSSSAQSEVRKFLTTKTTISGFDPDSDQEYDAMKDRQTSRYFGGGYERDSRFDEPYRYTTNYDSSKWKRYKNTGDIIKLTVDTLPPEQLKTYKELRKIAVKAFNEADEKGKADFKLNNPDRQYDGQERAKIVANAVTEAEKAVNAVQPLSKFKIGSHNLTEGMKKDVFEDKEKLASLVVTRLTYEKDDFLRVKGYYKRDSADGGKYLFLTTPFVEY